MAILFVMACLSCQSYLHGQNLYGIVQEQNSGRKPVQGVLIKSSFGANQVTTKNKGDFILTFQDARAGKSVILQAEKANWIVTDKTKLETNLPLDPLQHPHIIVMCRRDIWEQQNKDYKALLEKYIRTSYEKEKASLNRMDERYQRQIDSLQNKYTNLEKGLNELADLYNRTNTDDLTEIEKKAYSLFRAGNIEACMRLRESLESEKNFLKAGQKEKQLDSLSKRLDTAKTSNQNTKAFHKRNIQEEARLAKLNLDFRKADEKLEFLALNDSTDYDNLFEYAYFLQSQNQNDKAISYFSKAIKLAKNEREIADIQNNLGLLFLGNNNYIASEQAFNTSLQISKSLSKDTLEYSQSYIAMTLMNLGLLYYREKKFQASETVQVDAIKILRRLNTIFPDYFRYSFIQYYNNLGMLLLKEQKYTESEQILQEALAMYKGFERSEDREYSLIEAALYQNLGNLYMSLDNYGEAEKAHLAGLKILRKLADDDSAAFIPNLAGGLNDLGAFYVKKGNFIDANKSLMESVNISRKLVLSNPSAYEPEFTRTLSLLGISYSGLSQFREAEDSFLESIKIGRRISANNPSLYDSRLCTDLILFGQVYVDNRKNEEAEKCFIESIAIMRRYPEDSVISRDLRATIEKLGVLYEQQGDYSAAEKTYIEGIEVGSKLLASKLHNDELAFCNAVVNLGYLYNGDYYSDSIVAYFKYSEVADSILAHYPDSNVIKKDKMELYWLIQSPEKVEIDYLRKQMDKRTDNKERIPFQLQIIKVERKIAAKDNYRNVSVLSNDLGSLSWLLLFDRQFEAAEIAARDGLQLSKLYLKDDYYRIETEWVNTNLALALLYQGKYAEAEKIYLAFKDKPYNNAFYKDTFLSDLDELEKAGITHKDTKKIRDVLKQ